jgi:hypothetical protein
MEKFKVKDLMITLNPSSAKHYGIYDCEQSTKPDDGTNCTTCTHNTTTLETNCTTCTHNTTTLETNCTTCTHNTAGGETCTSCTHNTSTTCIPHSKPAEKGHLSHELKQMELEKLKKTISRLQETEYA